MCFCPCQSTVHFFFISQQLFLLAQQELMKGGMEQTLENLHQILMNLKDKIKEEVEFKSSLAGDNAMRYLAKLGLVLKYEKQRVEERDASIPPELADGDSISEEDNGGSAASLDKESQGAGSAVDSDEVPGDVDTAATRVLPSATFGLDGTPDALLSKGYAHSETSEEAADFSKTDTPSKTTSSSQSLTKKPQHTMEFMAKESEREEELRKRWPDYLPWPTPEDCQRKPPPQYMVFTSTWLSVTAKKVK